MIKIIILTLTLLIISYADVKPYQNKEIVTALVETERSSGLSRKLLYTFAQVESNFEKNLITVNTTNENASMVAKRLIFVFSDSIKVVQGKNNKNTEKTIINITSKETKTIVSVAKMLYQLDIDTFDLGIMQINKCHLKNEQQIDDIFHLETNLSIAAEHIKTCWQKYGNSPKEVVECYNKGFKKKIYYDYFEKFEKFYNKNFN